MADMKYLLDTNIAIDFLNGRDELATIAFRRGARLKLPDSIIAATAWLIKATLVTRDRRLAALDWPGLTTITF